MKGEKRTESILRPLTGRPTTRYYVFLALALAGLAWYAQAYVFQLRNGMVVLGIGDWGSGGGIPWASMSAPSSGGSASPTAASSFPPPSGSSTSAPINRWRASPSFSP